MYRVNGRLKSSSLRPFRGHLLDVHFIQVEAAEPFEGREDESVEKARYSSPGSMRVEVADDGSFHFDLPYKKDLIGEVELTVLGPDGGRVERISYDVEDLPEELTLEVEPTVIEHLLPPARKDPLLGKRVSLNGRVLDRLGKRQAVDVQVVIQARSKRSQRDDFQSVMVVRTDGQGYFSGSYPRGEWAEAYALVGVGEGVEVPVHLEDESGSFPRHLILVVSLPQEEREATPDSCDELMPPRAPDPEDLVNAPESYAQDIGGRCVDFTKPNRTLEEFDSYFVVRTTDPDVGLPKRRRLSDELREQVVERYDQYGLPDRLKEPGVIREGGVQRVDSHGQPVQKASFTDNLGNRYVLVDEETSNPTSDTLGSDVSATSSASQPGRNSSQISHFDTDAVLDTLNKGAKGSLAEMEVHSLQRSLKEQVLRDGRPESGRQQLNAGNPVDWDEGPTLAQARTIAHGHILHYKQVWRADGYSLGDLLYSLPLAPCQKKHVAIVDWERRELGSRSEESRYTDSMQAELSHDRDISEIVNAGLDEHYEASSSASNWSASASASGFFGGIFSLGASGGAGGSSSRSRQDSSRNTAAAALQKIRERTQQAASSVRSQRATVVKQVRQGEAVTVTTEVVANHNHCHAITMEYFEVLRHFIVSQELVAAQECLFVPLSISEFDEAKALRWRDILSRYLLQRDIRGYFTALKRFHENNYEGIPEGIMADEPLEFIDGELTLRMMIAPPPRPNDDDMRDLSEGVVAPKETYFNTIIGPIAIELDQDPHDLYAELSRDEALFNQIFQERYAPRLAERLVGEIMVHLSDDNLYHDAHLDPTLISDYQPGGLLVVRLNFNGGAMSITRSRLQEIRLSLPDSVGDWITPHSKIVVERAHFAYRTRNLVTSLFHSNRVGDRLDVGDDVTFWTGRLNALERRNPRRADAEHAKALIDHLNEHIEYYHKVIWARMDSMRRFMLLDGFEAPNAPNGRSVASVVENRLIGIVGNSLVMPVAPGYQLDPYSRPDPENPTTLLEQYAPLTPPAPMRIAIPTKGVFAESVMGACNSCEKKDDTRFWRWEESPCPDNPTPIDPVSTGSRYRDMGDLKPSDFPAPIINLQNAPAIPDPAGLQQAMSLLSNPNLFKDMTGLDASQTSALKALSESLGASSRAGEKAVEMAHANALRKDRDRYLEAIKNALGEGLLDEKQAQDRVNDYLAASASGQAPKQEPEYIASSIDAASRNGQGYEFTIADASLKVEPDSRRFAKSASDVALAMLSPEERRAWYVDGKPSFVTTQSFEYEATCPDDTTNRLYGTLSKTGQKPVLVSVADFPGPGRRKLPVAGLLPGKWHYQAILESGSQARYVDSVFSIPLFFKIFEQGSSLNDVLESEDLAGERRAFLEEIRWRTEYFLRETNVRLVWALPEFADASGTVPDVPVELTDKGLFNRNMYVPVALTTEFGAPSLVEDSRTIIEAVAKLLDGQISERFLDKLKKYQDMSDAERQDEMFDLYGEAWGKLEDVTQAGVSIRIFVGTTRADINTARWLDPLVGAIRAAPDGSQERGRLSTLYRSLWARIVANTLTHEILHTVIGDRTELDAGGHTTTPEDILNAGIATFELMVGIEILSEADWPAEGSHRDLFGSAPAKGADMPGVQRVTAATQKMIDKVLPVPGRF